MLRDTSYIFVAKVIGYGIRILLPAFLVRVLTKADFGAYNQFFLIEILFQTVFQLGVNQAQFFFVPKDPKNAGGIFLNSIFFNVGLFAVAYSVIGVSRHQISEFLNMPVLVDLFWPLAVYTLLLMLTVCCSTYLMARKKFLQSAVLEVVNQVVVSIATLVAAYLTRDLKAIILALVLARFVCVVLTLAYIHFRTNGFASEHYFVGARKQFMYGVTLGVAGMLWTFLMRTHELFVSRFFDLETFAVYSAGCKRIPVLMFFTESIGPVALVQFAQLKAAEDWEGIRDLWNKVLGMTYGVGIPITIFFVLIAQPLITLMFTSEYQEAVFIFQINSVAALYQLLVPSRVLRAMDRNDISVKVHAGVLLALPFALYAGMTVAGMKGVIVAHAVMLILGRVAVNFVLNRIAPIRLRYVPPVADVWGFYRESFAKGRGYVEGLLGRNGSGS